MSQAIKLTTCDMWASGELAHMSHAKKLANTRHEDKLGVSQIYNAANNYLPEDL